ncbi:hypothetical protein LTS08_003865 [Lithohypha guttulata]|nr:hypothetical protein LTS08_003865 [Lithohypha guttulata]
MTGSVVVLPPSKVTWINKLSTKSANFLDLVKDRFSLQYTLFDDHIIQDPFCLKASIRTLRQHGAAMVASTEEEIKLACHAAFHSCADGVTQVNLATALSPVLSRLLNHMLVGKPLCRNERYMKNLAVQREYIMPLGMLLACFPGILRRPLGRVMKSYVSSIARGCMADLKPYYQHIIDYVGQDTRRLSAELENTYLRHYLDIARSMPNHDRAVQLDVITSMAVQLGSAAFNELEAAIPSLIADVLQAGTHSNLVQLLLEEIRPVTSLGFAELSAALWSADRLPILDSCVRETLRMHSMQLLSMQRKILKNTCVDDGSQLSEGTSICVSAYSIHRDHTFYTQPDSYDPFRFYKPTRNAVVATPAAVSYEADEHYLAFGYGNHICPGRRVATSVLKLVFIHLFSNYEIQLVDKEPKTRSIAILKWHWTDVKVRMSRKETVSTPRSSA